MKHTFLVDLDTDSDTDAIGIAVDLKEAINTHFQYECLDVRPWKTQSLLSGTPIVPQTPGGVLPPN